MYSSKVKEAWCPQLLYYFLSTRFYVLILNDWLNQLNDIVLVMRRWRSCPWVTGPDIVINPLLAPWLGWGGNGFFGSLSPGVTMTFFEGWLSFPSAFLLGAPFLTALGVDEDAPSYPFTFGSSFLRVVATLTCALCMATSIYAKDKWRALDQETIKRKNDGRK